MGSTLVEVLRWLAEDWKELEGSSCPRRGGERLSQQLLVVC